MSSQRPQLMLGTKRMAAAVFATALLVAGCSSDSDDTSSTTSQPVSNETTVGSEGEDTAEDSTTTSDDSADDSTTTSATADDTSPDDVVANPPEKTWKDALDAAKAEFDGDVTKIELEQRRSGGLEYKIELISSDTEFSIQFDADTLEVLSTDEDDLDDDADEERSKVFDPADMINLEEAAETARGEVDGVIEEWKIEGKDDGRVQYEFDIARDGESGDTEVQVDAKTGELLHDD